MRKRYYIDALNKSVFGKTYYDACAKPRVDGEKIAHALGFETIYLYGSRLQKLGKPIWKKVLLHGYNIWHMLDVMKQSRQLSKIKDADVFVQFGFSTEAMQYVVWRLKRQGNRVILLVHDVESFRFKEVKMTEAHLMSYVDVVIVHSEPMRQRLKEIGYEGRVEVLEFFDYLNDYQPSAVEDDIRKDIRIVFAGNLSKSTFIQQLHTLDKQPGYQYNLYGKTDHLPPLNDVVTYKGFFANDDIAAIDGTWGLVWDGESLDTCSGNFGEYLKVNAPFKFSMCMARALPVIVWKQSAMAYYVEKYHLGITVNSLHDVYSTISSLTDDEINTIQQSVRRFSAHVRHGDMLITALTKALDAPVSASRPGVLPIAYDIINSLKG